MKNNTFRLKIPDHYAYIYPYLNKMLNILCVSGCRDPFSALQGRFAYGGQLNSAATSDAACADACRTSSRTCYGYDWNPSGQCYLHYNLQDIDASKLQQGQNVIHYRRQFLCTPTAVPPQGPSTPGGKKERKCYLSDDSIDDDG